MWAAWGCFRSRVAMAVSKLRFCTIFILKMIFLPRQARDKHRENSKRNAFSLGLPSGHVFVQEAGALFGVADAATAAKALGYTAAAARHDAVFTDFREALIRNVTANDVEV